MEHAETFYRHIVGLRLANQVASSFQSVSDPNEVLRVSIMRFIVPLETCGKTVLHDKQMSSFCALYSFILIAVGLIGALISLVPNLVIMRYIPI